MVIFPCLKTRRHPLKKSIDANYGRRDSRHPLSFGFPSRLHGWRDSLKQRSHPIHTCYYTGCRLARVSSPVLLTTLANGTTHNNNEKTKSEERLRRRPNHSLMVTQRARLPATLPRIPFSVVSARLILRTSPLLLLEPVSQKSLINKRLISSRATQDALSLMHRTTTHKQSHRTERKANELE